MSMKITPIEIRQKTFEKAFRGYEKQEVQAFLASLAKEWERLQADHKDIKAKLEQSQKETAKLREVEESLFKTLKTAEDTRTNLIEQASKTAELYMKETQIKTESLLSGAKNRAKDMLEKAESKAMEIVENAQVEIRKMQKSYATIEQHREQLLSSLKIISQDILHKLKRMENMPTPSAMASFEEHIMQTKHLQEESSLETEQVLKSLDKNSPSAPKPENEHKAAPTKQPKSKAVPLSEAISTPKNNNNSENGSSFFDELE